MKVCIICRILKSDFNKEHIIPAAIGGTMTTNLVCKECNSLLGTKIDQPFSNTRIILYYRKLLSISRGIRSIKNSLSGIITVENGRKFRYETNTEGEIEKILIHKLPSLDEIDNNGCIEITVDKRNQNEILKQLSERFETDDIIVKSIITTKGSESTIRIEDKENVLAFEFIKMLYEYACEKIDSYVDTDDAIKYSDMLFKDKIDENMKDMISLKPEIMHDIFSPIHNLLEGEHTHIIGLFGHKLYGLIGFSRVFSSNDLFYSCILSKSDKFKLIPLSVYKQRIG